MSTSIPVAVKPLFRTTCVNQPIGIYEGEVKILREGYSDLLSNGLLQWRWMPSPDLYLTVYLDSEANAHDAFEYDEITLVVPGFEKMSFRPTNFHFGDSITLSATARSHYVMQTSNLPELQCLRFHLSNFLPYLGEGVIDEDEQGRQLRSGRLVLSENGWRVTIDNLRETSDLLAILKESGGHAIMHSGQLEKENGTPFTVEDARAFLQGLSFFLSFAAGRWTQPILWWVPSKTTNEIPKLIIPTGLRLDSWHTLQSWSSHRLHEGRADMGNMFPGFMARYRQAPDLVRLSVAWYTEVLSDKLVSDSRIVLTQVAVELLAESLPPLLGCKALKGAAEQRLRGLLLLRLPHMNLEVPASLSRLTSILDQPPINSWNKGASGLPDGASVIISIRNKIAHGARTSAEKALLKNNLALYEVSQLGIWYLEHILLSWFGFKGRYRSRIILTGWVNSGEIFPPLSSTTP
jgi:hypothetical protein